MTKIGSLITIFSLFFCASHAQNTTKGTDFWFGFMENLDLIFNTAPTFSVVLSAEEATTGSIFQASTGRFQTFSLSVGETQEIKLPNTVLYTLGSDVIEQMGFRIQSNRPIRATARHYRRFFSESTAILPTIALDTDYLPTTFSQSQGQSQFIIVATEDNTIVEINLSVSAISNSGNVRRRAEPYKITLKAGDLYQIQSNNDMVGSRIRSLNSKKIAVFAGSRTTVVDCEATSHLYDQQLPLSMWAKNYGFVPFAFRQGDIIRVVTAQDSTTFRIGCTSFLLEKSGDFKDLRLDTAAFITASKPISVAQIMRGGSCDRPNTPINGSIGDPNMLMLQPLGQLSKRVLFQIADNQSLIGGLSADSVAYNFVNIITPTNAKTNFRLNGERINNFRDLGLLSAYSYAQIRLKQAKNDITSDTGFLAFSYQLTAYNALTEHLGFDFQKNIDADFSLPNNPVFLPQPLCLGDTINLKIVGNTKFDSLSWRLDNGKITSDREPRLVLTKATKLDFTLFLRDFCGETRFYTLSLPIIEQCPRLTKPFPCDFLPFPNPTNTVWHIQTKENKDKSVNIDLFDTTGRLIWASPINFDVTGKSTNFPTPQASGLYIMRLNYNGQSCTQKIIKTE